LPLAGDDVVDGEVVDGPFGLDLPLDELLGEVGLPELDHVLVRARHHGGRRGRRRRGRLGRRGCARPLAEGEGRGEDEENGGERAAESDHRGLLRLSVEATPTT